VALLLPARPSGIDGWSARSRVVTGHPVATVTGRQWALRDRCNRRLQLR
jgi:hypothetical protein